MAEGIFVRSASVLVNGSFQQKNILVKDGMIARISDGLSFGGTDFPVLEIEASGKRVLPGFIDIHTHGAVGVDFNNATEEDVRKVSSFYASHGVTSILPTLSPDSIDRMKTQLALLTSPETAKLCPQIFGIHLEGPFICAAYKGALPEHFFLPCDTDRFADFQKAARGKIVLLTMSPELDGADKLIRKLTEDGVRVSLGHSGASYEQTMNAIRAGAASATHVMNAMKMLHMHDPSILTAVLESDIYAEMICDGFHLHPPIVRLLLKVKGLGRMMAVSDSMSAAGYPDGKYAFGAGEVIVENGDAKLSSNGARAGSTLTMSKAVRNIRDFTALALEDISKLVSENPARMLGVFENTGSIEEGKQADMVLLDSNDEVSMTIVRGRIAYEKTKQ